MNALPEDKTMTTAKDGEVFWLRFNDEIRVGKRVGQEYSQIANFHFCREKAVQQFVALCNMGMINLGE